MQVRTAPVRPERSRRASISLLLAFTFGCVGPEDTPGNVRDLRVLGMAFDPPELMVDSCDPSSLLSDPKLLSTIQFSALVADPAGEGREVTYEVVACAHPSDRTCSEEAHRQVLAQGRFVPELQVPFNELRIALPALALTPHPTSVLLAAEVRAQDAFGGLGGVRMPIVLRVSAGEEEVYAQKLFVISCKFFPEMAENLNPVLPGVAIAAGHWLEGDVVSFEGRTPFRVEPLDFESLEESYVVPSYELSPIHLRESWKISWHSDVGRMSPTETGGTDFAGEEGRHRADWQPPASITEPTDVQFYMVVRDGRGGQSWLHRQARYIPEP